MQSQIDVSIIIPLLDEEESLSTLTDWVLQSLKEEEFLEDLLELGIESYDEIDDGYELLVSPDEFQNIIQFLEQRNYNLEGNISLIAINSISVSNDKIDSILNLINALEEHDDVQKVHTNISIDE